MKTKKNVLILLVTFILASCAPAKTSLPSTKPPVPSVTSTIAVPSATSSPTKIPVTPTETKPGNVDFLAHSENVFPLTENKRGFFKFIGTMDLGNPIYEMFTAPDGITRIYVSFIITDGNVEFLVPAYWVHRECSYLSTTLLPNGDPTANTDYYPSDERIKHSTEWSLEFLEPKGQPKVEVTLILDSGLNPDALTPMFGYLNPFPPLWEKTNWDEAVRKFVQTGNPNDLPKINGFPILPAVSIRNTGSVPFWDE